MRDAAPLTAVADASVADAPAPTIAPTVPTVPGAPPLAVAAGDVKIAQVELAGPLACARRSDGGVRCWGSATPGAVGSVVPRDVRGAPEAAAIHLAFGQLAIAARSGDVAIGPATSDDGGLALVPIGEAIDVRVDAPDRAWVLTRTGDVYRLDGATPSKVLLNVIALSSRERDSTDALHRDGTVTTLTRGKAVPVKGITDAESLFGTRCAHRRSGAAVCWDSKGKTAAWTGPLNTVDRRASDGVTCTLAKSGVACVGRNDAGQLGAGPGDDTDARSVAKIVPLPGKPVAIAGGGGAWCAVLDGGALACWGANEVGQIGDGTLIDRFTPVVVTGAASATPLVAPARGAEPVAEAPDRMSWADLPKGCTRPSLIPGPPAIERVVSAYAVSRARATELWFADFELVAGGYRPGFAVARGAQTALVYTLDGAKLARGRYRTGDRGKSASLQLGTGGSQAAKRADVLVEKVVDGWLCGTLLDPDDAAKRTPFAARITKPRY